MLTTALMDTSMGIFIDIFGWQDLRILRLLVDGGSLAGPRLFH